MREAGSAVPIAGASVFLIRSSNQKQFRTTTDAKGHFKLEGLEAGRHLVGVVREGYVVPRRQEISGYPYKLATGQHLTDIRFDLIPTGILSGRVLNPDGKPESRVQLQLLQRLYVMGQPQWSLVNRGGSARNEPILTNERGEFRAPGMDPGEYKVRFVPQDLRAESVLPGGTSIGPFVYDSVTIEPGHESSLDDVKLKDDRRGWIRILVVNESGTPLEGLGNWDVKPPGWVGTDYVFVEQRVVNQYREVQPDANGAYDIVASWQSPQGLLAGTASVDYRGVDVMTQIVIRKPDGKLEGAVMLQDGRPLMGVEVAIGPKISYFARSGPEGALKFPAIYPGQYQLGYIRGIPTDSVVLGVSQGGRDVFREGIRVGGAEKLEVLIREGGGLLSGKVTGSNGAPVHNALVAVVPEPPLSDRKDYYGAYRDTRTDQNGEFEIRGMTPGTYQAYAWSDAPASAFRNMEFMRGFAGKGTEVKVEMGTPATVQLDILDLEQAPRLRR